MRPPDVLPTQHAADQRNRGVHDKRGENDQREHCGPCAVQPAAQSDGTRQESNRNRTNIAEEYARWRKIKSEKTSRGESGAQRNRSQNAISLWPCRNRVGQEAKKSHATGQAVSTVHKIVKIRHPGQG